VNLERIRSPSWQNGHFERWADLGCEILAGAMMKFVVTGFEQVGENWQQAALWALCICFIAGLSGGKAS